MGFFVFGNTLFKNNHIAGPTYRCRIRYALFVAPWYIDSRNFVDGLLKSHLQVFTVSLVVHTVSHYDIHCQFIS